MESDSDKRRRALQEFMARAGMNANQWEALSGLGDGTLRKYLNDTGTKTLTEATYTRLAYGATQKLNRLVTITDLLEGDATVQRVEPNALAANVSSLDRPEPDPQTDKMPKDVPILGTVSGGSGGFLNMNGDAVVWARRPPRFNGRSDIFGLYVDDDTMAPKYETNDLIFVERIPPPRVGDCVVAEIKDPSGSRVVLKKLAGRTDQSVRLEQFSPAKTIDVPIKHVMSMFRVLTVNDLLGV